MVLRGDAALPGAAALVDWLRASGLPFLFLTNYPSMTPSDLRGRFLGAGLDVPERHFYTSAMATAEFLNGQAGARRRAFVIGEGALVDAIRAVGFTVADTNADFVVLGETTSYGFDMIWKAGQLLRRGARFVATNPDVAGPDGWPSCGALAASIERVSGRTPFYVGKPSAFMMRAALRYLRVHSEDAVIVGDNMDTDIIAGVQSGMTTILVLSGVSRADDLDAYAYRPTHVMNGAAEVVAFLQSGPTDAELATPSAGEAMPATTRDAGPNDPGAAE